MGKSITLGKLGGCIWENAEERKGMGKFCKSIIILKQFNNNNM